MIPLNNTLYFERWPTHERTANFPGKPRRHDRLSVDHESDMHSDEKRCGANADG